MDSRSLWYHLSLVLEVTPLGLNFVASGTWQCEDEVRIVSGHGAAVKPGLAISSAVDQRSHPIPIPAQDWNKSDERELRYW